MRFASPPSGEDGLGEPLTLEEADHPLEHVRATPGPTGELLVTYHQSHSTIEHSLALWAVESDLSAATEW